ncbi:LysM domain-containing protein [Zoogloea sp.]|jgi:hypothetical protein|uniref:LysM peptidoglycan-binding domain-containing protein n=1 Tax=Zoogloea sp. TaxID=49181 RepID=UPI002C322B22|nr:LysM domain-containing protein [Zoogloea sp.]HQA12081.1 LysM domain-containing protein [Zoogloea sp.]
MGRSLYDAIRFQSIDSPELNIRAAIAYLFTRMALFDTKSIFDDSEMAVRTVVVVHGDSLDRIARRVGTTVEVLGDFRHEVSKSPLRVGEKLRYRKAHMGKVIVGWRKWDFATVAARYGGGGDAAYAEKLSYVFKLFSRLKR